MSKSKLFILGVEVAFEVVLSWKFNFEVFYPGGGSLGALPLCVNKYVIRANTGIKSVIGRRYKPSEGYSVRIALESQHVLRALTYHV